MNLSRHATQHFLYEFDQGYEVSYINYSPRNEQLESQLIVTLERDHERKTFAFYQPEFADIEKNLITSQGIYIAAITRANKEIIEVGDTAGGFVYFSAQRVRNITPGG